MKKGLLITWKDDRGFGFIQPNSGGKEIFLHISSLKKSNRRPKVGDTILYEQVTESNGKVRATRASIQGAAYRSFPSKSKKGLLEGIASIAIMAAIGLFTMELSPSRSPSIITSIAKPGCKIKGNISYNTSKKIYHLPGMKDYESTVIDPTKGEKWFCEEAEAINKGWHKAPK